MKTTTAKDCLALPFVYLAALLLKRLRAAGVHRMPLCKKALLRVGVFPIRRHYYEPLFHEDDLRFSLSADRPLPGIAWNVKQQLDLLSSFHFHDELRDLATGGAGGFRFNNMFFESGDAEYWYSLIRLKKPRRIFEIGSGHSTLITLQAIQKNKEESPDYQCKHLCIEPYEMPWLEKTGVSVMRKRVEEVGLELFGELSENDILFIDSSHVIRPQGDVLYEYLELLPSLQHGVIVHLHDIFSPRDYPDAWIREDVRLWNEQYLLEAFLSCNRQWTILGALNFLHHHHYAALGEKCPYLRPESEPGSFYIQKTG